MRTIGADDRRMAATRAWIDAVCAEALLGRESGKINAATILSTVAGVVAVIVLVRMVNLYFAGA